MSIETVVSQIRPSKEDGGVEYIAVLGRCSVGLGDFITFKMGQRIIGDRYICYRKSSKLKDVTQEDLDVLNPAYRNKQSLWSTLEKAYGGGLPGEFEITFIGLSKDPFYPQVEPIFHDDFSTPDTMEQLLDEEEADDLLEYEEEFGDYRVIEKIKRKEWEE